MSLTLFPEFLRGGGVGQDCGWDVDLRMGIVSQFLDLLMSQARESHREY